MSFVLTPEMLTTAAQDLAAMHSTLGEVSVTAAGPTTALAAAAEDEVSAGIAALFGAFGREYQIVSSQAQAFHERFVNLLNAGASAYCSAEAANVSSFTAAASVNTDPYQNLIANTTGNLQRISNTWTNKTAPSLLRAVTGYPQLISTSLATGNPLPLLGIPVRLAQGGTTLYQAISAPMSLTPSLTLSGLSLELNLGLPELLGLNALGAPVNAAMAAGTSATSFVGAVSTGDPVGAATALFGAPAHIVDGFLNGHQTLSTQLLLPGLSVTANVPLNGLLGPLEPLTATATLPGLPLLNTLTVTGSHFGGLVPTLLEYVPELLVTALGP
ncbi:PE family protein [Mycobacterium kansasii]|uniref:PE family protein n=3 Tax=Mycobacterium kansasii TaxID=1768 RepID=A0A1V3WJ98_MYCKA|nr:PE family protein [Mycobacterium kansasii]EUA03622.1 PE family protein [Mycobacterium kansasii 824]AGZ52160.1 PE family protein [Mycobacterium kansasii ATCC 12478]ARG56153.1 PE family protein [Mycobacterium kansasii]ARG61598.1 PE family protein [Mycobacterium kansasii]ARG69283.1 PE family protein [Mycobacterium kansasii]